MTCKRAAVDPVSFSQSYVHDKPALGRRASASQRGVDDSDPDALRGGRGVDSVCWNPRSWP